MVSLRKLLENDLEQVQKLTVNDDQLRYVGTIGELLKDAPNTWHFHVISDGEKIVGFFNIDIEYSKNYPFTKPNELGLRAFFIDSTLQGRGYGKAATQALSLYLIQAYSQFSSIALTVNCKNPSAYQCYLKGGFEDSGELYHGGSAGPQHILRMALQPTSV